MDDGKDEKELIGEEKGDGNCERDLDEETDLWRLGCENEARNVTCDHRWLAGPTGKLFSLERHGFASSIKSTYSARLVRVTWYDISIHHK